MTTTTDPDLAAAITAAETALAEARADVDRLRGALTDEETARESYERRVLMAADGRAEALRRHPRKESAQSGQAAGKGNGSGNGQGDDDGRTSAAPQRGGAGVTAGALARYDITSADGRAEARRRTEAQRRGGAR